MAVKKKKVIKKKSIKKPANSSPKAKKRKGKKEMPEGIIFDSTIGKTDALFVSDPEPVAQQNDQQRLNPIIDEVLKEIDESEKPETLVQPQQPEDLPKPIIQPVLETKKKTWWQKLFKI